MKINGIEYDYSDLNNAITIAINKLEYDFEHWYENNYKTNIPITKDNIDKLSYDDKETNFNDFIKDIYPGCLYYSCKEIFNENNFDVNTFAKKNKKAINTIGTLVKNNLHDRFERICSQEKNYDIEEIDIR